MMGAGKKNTMFMAERISVFFRYLSHDGLAKKYLNHFSPTHWLPKMPE